MAERAKDLLTEKGIMSSPNPKRGKKLAENVSNKIIAFYENDANSRELAGKNYFKSVKQPDGSRRHVQKRLVYCNLNELYETFKEKHPEVELSFSAFAELLPKHCILAEASGTDSVCVCIHHENEKLMIEAVDFPSLTMSTAHPLKNSHDFINLTMCEDPQPKCHLGECEKCPGPELLAEHIRTVFDDNDIDRIEFYAWTETDRAAMKVNVSTGDAFIEELCERDINLTTHAFIAKQQGEYLH